MAQKEDIYVEKMELFVMLFLFKAPAEIFQKFHFRYACFEVSGCFFFPRT